LKQIRRHITYANVMSSIAVFLILGGATAFAAVQKIGANEIKANSIKTGKIVKEAVTAGKIKNLAVIEAKLGEGAVTASKIGKEAVTTEKIAKDAVTTEKLNTNAVTNGKIAGEAVSTGKLQNSSVTTSKLAGDAVKAGQFGTVTRRGSANVSVANNDTALGSVACNAGEQVLGGGVFWTNGFNAATAKEQHVVHSFPSGNGWAARTYNNSGVAREFIVYALCLEAG
jgi:hypothetical protein